MYPFEAMMGTLRFALEPPDLMQKVPELGAAYITGMDRVPSRTQVQVTGDILTCYRNLPESGVVHMPWPIDGFGQVMLRTATLREQDEPYRLQVELARGKVNQLRNQLGDWELMGLAIPASIRAEMRAVMGKLSVALTGRSQPASAARAAEAALAAAVPLSDKLCQLYADQLLKYRHQQYPQLNTLLSCRVGTDVAAVVNSPEFCRAFNAVTVQLTWKDVEPAEGEYNWEPFDALVDWCLENKLVIKGGPLIQWSPNSLPAWLWMWEDQFDTLLNFASDFVETVISRYRGRIRLWEIVARSNYGVALSLEEEKRVRMTVRALRTARDLDPEATYLITLVQPWAEYMARRDYEYSPLNFADALIRADLGLGAIGVEIVMGYDKDASYCRDHLEISEMLDRYAVLGVPLHVSLAVPSGWGADEKASSGWSFGGGRWHGEWSEQTQADWLEQTIRLVAAKPYVQEIDLSHFSDAAPHEFALAGLVRTDGTPKPALERVMSFRQHHLR